MEQASHVIQDLANTHGLERAEVGETGDVISLYVDYGVYDGTLSSELLTALGRWDGALYQSPEDLDISGDYQFVLNE